MTVPYRAFYNVLQTNKASVGRGALTPPRRNHAYRGKRCNLFVGDDACIVPWPFAVCITVDKNVITLGWRAHNMRPYGAPYSINSCF